MADLSVAASVSRTSLSLGDLALEDDETGNRLVQFSVGAIAWRRNTVRSPFVAGDMLVSAVKEQVSSNVTVRVHGSSASQLHTRLAALARAFEQFTYHLNIILGGVQYSYVCQPADYVVGDEEGWNKYGLMVYQQDVRFNVPRNPIPVVGGM